MPFPPPVFIKIPHLPGKEKLAIALFFSTNRDILLSWSPFSKGFFFIFLLQMLGFASVLVPILYDFSVFWFPFYIILSQFPFVVAFL